MPATGTEYDDIRRALAPLREQGVRLAVDPARRAIVTAIVLLALELDVTVTGEVGHAGGTEHTARPRS